MTRLGVVPVDSQDAEPVNRERIFYSLRAILVDNQTPSFEATVGLNVKLEGAYPRTERLSIDADLTLNAMPWTQACNSAFGNHKS